MKSETPRGTKRFNIQHPRSREDPIVKIQAPSQHQAPDAETSRRTGRPRRKALDPLSLRTPKLEPLGRLASLNDKQNPVASLRACPKKGRSRGAEVAGTPEFLLVRARQCESASLR